MNKKKMDEVVADFRAQWSEDFRKAMEREPERYTLTMGMGTVEIPDFSGIGCRFCVDITDRLLKKTGSATCNPSDKVDVLLGQAIAWARLNNIPLPKQLKPNRITTFRKFKVGGKYRSQMTEPFTVLSKVRHDDMLIYTIYREDLGEYELLRCPIHNAILMNKKFNIC